MSKSTFEFLYATRFWAMVLGATAMYLQSKGWIGQPEMLLIASITAGFTIVRTADRMAEQKVIAAGIATGEMKVQAVLPTVPPNTDTLTSTLKTRNG